MPFVVVVRFLTQLEGTIELQQDNSVLILKEKIS